MLGHRLLTPGRRCAVSPLFHVCKAGSRAEPSRPLVARLQAVPRSMQGAWPRENTVLTQQRACSSSAVEANPELLAQLRELPQEQQEALADALRNGSLGEAEADVEGVQPISRAQMTKLFIATAIPMVGFGFMDNCVMIICGEFIEVKLGAALCISTLAAAGLGNLVSDLVGLGAGGIIEAGAAKLGVDAPPLTLAQLASRPAVMTRHTGSVLGLAFGCVLGMFPLFFHDEDDMRLRTVFGRYDKNGDGALDYQEIWLAFNDAKMYPSERDMHHLFDKYDLNKDGEIVYDEFKVMVEDMEKRLRQDSSLDSRSVMASAALYLDMDA